LTAVGLTSIPVALASLGLDHLSLARARPAPAAPARGPCGPEVSSPRLAVQTLTAMGLTSIPVALAVFDLDHPSLARARPASAAPARGPCGPEVSGPRPAVQILRAMGLASVRACSLGSRSSADPIQILSPVWAAPWSAAFAASRPLPTPPAGGLHSGYCSQERGCIMVGLRRRWGSVFTCVQTDHPSCRRARPQAQAGALAARQVMVVVVPA